MVSKAIDDLNPSNLEKKTFTLGSFLNNPTGDKGTNTLSRRLVLDEYGKKLYELSKNGFKPQTAFYDLNGSIFLHVKVPSETHEEMTYDVVFEFVGATKDTVNLAANEILFFSNSPSFVFTYANVFSQFGLLTEVLKGRYSDKVFEELPKIRNPDFTTFYEKSVTMALIYIRENGLLNLASHKNSIRNVPKSKFKERIRTDVEVLEDYRHRTKLAKSAAKKEKRTSDTPKKEKKVHSSTVSSKVSNKVSSVANNKVSNKVNNRVNNKVSNSKVNSKVNNRVK